MRILVATDQPYWRRAGGAQQRIYSLLRGLQDLGEKNFGPDASVEIATFFLGDPSDLPVVTDSLGTFFCPRNEKSGWGVLESLRQFFANRTVRAGTAAPSADTVRSIPKSLTLDDYRWSWVFPHFRRAVSQFRPDVILLEYVTMIYLREPIENTEIVWALDTHDRLAHRNQQFIDAGKKHWLSITEDEERLAWDAADLLIAIQQEEAEWMHAALPEKAVVVAEHGVFQTSTCQHKLETPKADGLAKAIESHARKPSAHRENDSPIRFGFIASDNFPNQQAIELLIEVVWPKIFAQLHQQTPVLVLAGSICKHAKIMLGDSDERLGSFIKLLGVIDELNDFYSQVDVILNPVDVGTGLKIKTCEALTFGKPLIATEHAAGRFAKQDAGIVLANSAQQWVEEILRFCSDRASIDKLAKASSLYSEKHLSADAVYDPLFQKLLQMIDAKRES